MFQRVAKLIAIFFLCLVAIDCAWCQAVSVKARILQQLTQASKQQLSTRASVVYKASPKDVEQLALDLIVYRWISKQSHMPTDVKNIDEIISAICNISTDELIKWSTSLFATHEKTMDNITLPPRNDSRVEVFSDLNLYIKTAIDYRERYPKEAVNALQNAIKICQDMNLDLCEAILLKELGDQFFYNMSRYWDASACYQRAATWIFPAYGCIASSAIVYDDWGTLNTENRKVCLCC